MFFHKKFKKFFFGFIIIKPFYATFIRFLIINDFWIILYLLSSVWTYRIVLKRNLTINRNRLNFKNSKIYIIFQRNINPSRKSKKLNSLLKLKILQIFHFILIKLSTTINYVNYLFLSTNRNKQKNDYDYFH